MRGIRVENRPTRHRLEHLGVFEWGVWSREISVFPWTYDLDETCYFLAGEVVVTPKGGDPVALGEGDLVTFSAGHSCTWEIRREVRKH
jgi:uncharacterized cupin superfamily protein